MTNEAPCGCWVESKTNIKAPGSPASGVLHACAWHHDLLRRVLGQAMSVPAHMTPEIFRYDPFEEIK